mgnify:CR=1 FL=1
MQSRARSHPGDRGVALLLNELMGLGYGAEVFSLSRRAE